jgi:predicted N-acetyltransferase YhbS
MTPAMLKGFGLRSALNVGSWLGSWATHDPSEPHVHLGPIAVDPEAQGRGIGRHLMQRYTRELDCAGWAGYLETDRPENVAFYERFGFELIETSSVLAVPNYFMLCEAHKTWPAPAFPLNQV